jgi:hypothetical protein
MAIKPPGVSDAQMRYGSHGTMLAIGIVLLWFAGACFFVAFLSGKAASMTIGADSSGKPVGPTDIGSLIGRVSDNVAALEGATGSGSTGATPGTGATS